MNDRQTYILKDRAPALASYPHAHRVGNLLFLSGTSSRTPSNSHIGVHENDDGTFTLNIEEQTEAVIENMRAILNAAGADLSNLVDMTTFLVNMDDYAGYNTVYNRYFEAETGPSRTTVAVHQLPHPNLLIEIKGIAHIDS